MAGMKSLSRLLAVFALGAAVLGHATGFEGKVSLTLSSGKGKSQALDYSIKGSAVRIDMNAEGNTFASIMDLQKMEMLMLMPNEQTYMVMPIKEKLDKAMDQAVEKDATIEKTGRTETILGYQCDEYVTKDRKNTTELWIAEGLGTFMGLGSNGGGGGMFGGRSKAAEGWEQKFKGKPGFPLRVISRDTKGRETFRMEATKIEPGSLPASLFQPPEGWQKFQMPNMSDMLKGLRP